MVRQALDLLGHPLRGERLQRLDDACVQHAPPLLEQTVIGDLMGQGVFEGEVALGEEPRLIEEFGGLQVGEAVIEVRLGQLGNGLHQGHGHLGANDRSALEHVLLLRRQPVDARCQHRLHRGGHLEPGRGACSSR